MRRKIRENYWFAGPIGFLMSILILTKNDEENTASEDSVG
jgi:hypothetical protein